MNILKSERNKKNCIKLLLVLTAAAWIMAFSSPISNFIHNFQYGIVSTSELLSFAGVSALIFAFNAVLLRVIYLSFELSS